MPTAPTPLSVPPPTPDRSAPDTFDQYAVALDDFRKTTERTEKDALASNVYGNAVEAAASAATAAAAVNQLQAASFAFKYSFDSSVTMGDPGTGLMRLNNATIASATAIAFDATSSDTGNPDVSDFIATWGASTNTVKGQIILRKVGAPATFATFNITAAVVDNTEWLQVAVAWVADGGTLSAADEIMIQFVRTGDGGGSLSGNASGTIDMNGFAFNESLGADVASAATIDLDATAGNCVDVTGAVTISAITLSPGHSRVVRFTGAPTLTNSASLVMLSGANVTVAAGEFMWFRGYAAGVVRCQFYSSASTPPLAKQGAFAYGITGVTVSMKNLISTSGIISADVTGVGTARRGLAATPFGTGEGAFAYGYTGATVSMKNLISTSGIISADVTGVGTARFDLAATPFGTGEGAFAYGYTNVTVSMENLISTSGIISADVTGVGTARSSLAATPFGTGEGAFAYGITGVTVSMKNLISTSGIISADVTGVGTARQGLAATPFGTGEGAFAYGYAGVMVSMKNLISTSGIISADVTGVGTARYGLAATPFGAGEGAFAYGNTGATVSMKNLISTSGIISADVTGVGTARNFLAASTFY